jgi:predicted amidohydrolase
MLSSDPADLFCQLFDRLDDHVVADDRRWQNNRDLRELRREVRDKALDLDLEPDWLERRLATCARRTGEGEPAAMWAAASGIDEALSRANPSTQAPPRPGQRSRLLVEIVSDRYAIHGRFDTGDKHIGGALLPQLAGHGRASQTTVSRDHAFPNVRRVPADIWDSADVEFSRLRSKQAPMPVSSSPNQELMVGCVPLLESLEQEIELTEVERDGAHFFSAKLNDDCLKERIRNVLRTLDRSGAVLGVAPELSLSEAVLATWRLTMKDDRPPRGSALKWVFVGSGPLGGDEIQPPYNCGVLLDRETGAEVHRQEKLYPFTLDKSQINDWNLGEYLSGEQVEEDMTRGRKLRVLETPLGRVAVLICEDLTKVLEDRVGRMVRGFGASLLIAPVFSKEVMKFRWEHTQARTYADQAGARTVVANSLVIARRQGIRGEVGTSLVNAPEGKFQIGMSRSADDVSLFRLTSKDVELQSLPVEG